jgi:hypothetical protein
VTDDKPTFIDLFQNLDTPTADWIGPLMKGAADAGLDPTKYERFLYPKAEAVDPTIDERLERLPAELPADARVVVIDWTRFGRAVRDARFAWLDRLPGLAARPCCTAVAIR